MFHGIVFDRNASALELLTTRNTFVTKELAALYGLPTTGLSSTSLTATTLPANGLRAGLLTRPGSCRCTRTRKGIADAAREVHFREVLLCTTIPLPPPDVSTVLPPSPAGEMHTKREQLTMHQSQARCAGCHAMTDPLGLTLENFDAIGKYRTTDRGKRST